MRRMMMIPGFDGLSSSYYYYWSFGLPAWF